MQNLEQTILSQFANSPTLLALINDFNAAVDPSPELNSFYDNVWNIATAAGWGLDNWGRIVGVSRVVSFPAALTGYLGFVQQHGSESFGHGTLFPGAGNTTNYALPDNAYKQLILTKALANISNCAIPSYNKILMQLFPGRGNAFVVDRGNMQMQLTFQFVLSAVEVNILKYSGAFAVPTGVSFTILEFPFGATFGFSQQYGTNGFGHGTFFGGLT
jgi:hypothetical protein